MQSTDLILALKPVVDQLERRKCVRKQSYGRGRIAQGGKTMTITIDATYEDGVLKPSQPLPFREHETVKVTVASHGQSDTEAEPRGNVGVPPQPSLGERIAALGRELPAEVLDSLPIDGASQHDHYIYGTPKGPERP
jgi:predicted DNA-binding antitoxin AbrB/MazE fold protein